MTTSKEQLIETIEPLDQENPVVVPLRESQTQVAEESNSEELLSSSSETYLLFKENERDEIVDWIKEAEEQLADLKLRKLLIEADFKELLAGYNGFILEDAPISTIARTNLLDYFTYELLQPLKSVELQKIEDYNTWQTKHFLVDYRLNHEKELIFNFKMNGVDERFNTPFLPILKLNTTEMLVQVSEQDVLELIRLWHVEKIFSRNQLSLINYDLNLLLAHFKELGFHVTPNLLDNTLPLATNLISSVSIDETILDQIFITTMENESYDFEKLANQRYKIHLNQGQSVTIDLSVQPAVLMIHSNDRKRSIVDFLTHYPFLVALVVSE